jgi:tRNA dimethylallyltransferase
MSNKAPKSTVINTPQVIAIVGATATGKSAIGVRLAKKFKGEVISADSRQVYRNLNLGTGKITKKEMRGVPHHLLDVVSAQGDFNVDKFKTRAEVAMSQIMEKGALPFVVGGTGFYIDTLLLGLELPNVKANPKLRAELSKKSLPRLMQILEKLDKVRAKTIDSNNKVRIIRAIEIARALGKVPALKSNPKYRVLWIGINLPPEVLKKKIDKRLKERIEKGMISEARALHRRGLSYKRMHALGLEYRDMAKFLKKEISQEEMIDKLKREIWQYAKRQNTWFKMNKKIKWFSPSDYTLIEREVFKFLNT